VDGQARSFTLKMVERSLIALVLALGLALAVVNLAVRLIGGGETSLLSPFYLEEKVSALARLGEHIVSSPLEPTCAPDPEKAIIAAALRHDVPVALALAVGRAESGHEPHRISAAGAMGLMQLMPATARDMGVVDPFDQKQSIDGGVRYLRWLLRRYGGDSVRAVAAYNAGPGTVPRRGPLVLPSETRVYVARVEAHEKAYARRF